MRLSSLWIAICALGTGGVVSAITNTSIVEIANELASTNSTAPRARGDALRRNNDCSKGSKKKDEKKNDRSTSSDSKDPKEDDDTEKDNDASLQLSDEEDDFQEKKNKDDQHKYMPKSSVERRGWRKWHRKCTPCPEDHDMKWRHPNIKWICGAYQTARRSFKSPCSMYLRNCQDGTMFVKIADHRCRDDMVKGKHFFYDYRVRLTDESTRSTSGSRTGETEEVEESTEYEDDSSGARRAIRRRKPRGRGARGRRARAYRRKNATNFRRKSKRTALNVTSTVVQSTTNQTLL